MQSETFLNNFIIYICDRLIVFYQKFISPMMAPRCRFFPSCSEYAKICIHQYPIHLAFRKITWRLLRCNPFNAGGLDYP